MFVFLPLVVKYAGGGFRSLRVRRTVANTLEKTHKVLVNVRRRHMHTHNLRRRRHKRRSVHRHHCCDHRRKNCDRWKVVEEDW